MAGSEKNPPNPLLLNDHCSVQGREDKVFAQGRQTRRAPKKDISASECRIQKSACFQTGELKNFVVSILRKSLIVNDRVFESAKLGLKPFIQKVAQASRLCRNKGTAKLMPHRRDACATLEIPRSLANGFIPESISIRYNRSIGIMIAITNFYTHLSAPHRIAG